jgi:hypothetical protein
MFYPALSGEQHTARAVPGCRWAPAYTRARCGSTRSGTSGTSS